MPSLARLEDLAALREPDLWRVPRCYAGATVFCVGAGPSLAALDPERLPGDRTIVCNTAVRFVGRTAFALLYGLAAVERCGIALASFAGEIVTVNSAVRARIPRARLIEPGPRWGMSRDAGRLAHGSCAGHGAIAFMALAGAARIVLVGYDMCSAEHRALAPHFSVIASDLRRAGVECLNATPGSALDCFERVHLRDVL